MLAYCKEIWGMNHIAEYECRFACGTDTSSRWDTSSAIVHMFWSLLREAFENLRSWGSSGVTTKRLHSSRNCARTLRTRWGRLFVTQQPDASTRVIDGPDLFLLSDRLPLETICYDGAYKVRYELGTAICGSYKPSKGTALNVGSSPLKSQPFQSPGSSFLFHCCFASRTWCGCKRCFGFSALFCSFEVNVFCFCFLNKMF